MVPILHALEADVKVRIPGFDQLFQQVRISEVPVVASRFDVVPLDFATDIHGISDSLNPALYIADSLHIDCNTTNSHELVALMAGFVTEI